jgi:hypothetical protein
MEFSLDPKSLGALVFWENVVQSLRFEREYFLSLLDIDLGYWQYTNLGVFIR